MLAFSFDFPGMVYFVARLFLLFLEIAGNSAAAPER
jgi:hypothetical protein